MPMTKEIAIQNARLGMAFEIRQLRKVKTSALEACRSSGSRGLFDVWSLNKDKLRLIQCKRNGYIEPEEREALKKFLREKPEWAQLEVHVMISNKITKKYIITKEEHLDRFKFKPKEGEENGESTIPV